MAIYKLTDLEQAIVYEIMHAAGIWKANLSEQPVANSANWNNISSAIMNYLKTRKLDVRPVMDYERTFANNNSYPVAYPLINAKTGAVPANVTTVFPSAIEIFDALIKFCVNNELYWDDCDKTLTKYEVDAFYDTTFGKEVFKYYGYTSQPIPTGSVNTQTPAAAQPAATPSQRKAPAARQAGGQPQKDYKSLGPLATKCRGILNNAQAVPSTGSLYKIYGIVKPGHSYVSEINLYVKPVLVANYGKGGEAAPGKNKIFIGTAKGYGYCPCLFTNVNDANAFIDSCLAKYSLPGIIDSLAVAKAPRVTKLFEVQTECGNCYISGSKINEALEEELEEEVDANSFNEDANKYEEISPEYFADVIRD